MPNYLIIYVDVEFIVCAIGTGYEAHPYIVRSDNDILQWLYFFNDPHQHNVSFGKRYKKHYMEGEVNYYGRFPGSIENAGKTFSLRHADYPLIELLEESGMLKLWRDEYSHHTQTVPDTIPTLLTFSSSITDFAKKPFVDYLKGKRFDIKSYTIPLAELVFQKLLREGHANTTPESASVVIEATNATLHFTKLVYHDQYFLKDGDVKSIPGMGIDPRKRALCKFLVGELNSLTGLLSSEQEKEEEVERFEPQSADLLRQIDATPGNRPFYIKNLSFRIAKSIKRDILVKKSDLESDTGLYLQYLTDAYNAFIEERCPNGIDYCCFVGNCFVSERIRRRFEDIVGSERTFFFKTTDVADLIYVYPRAEEKQRATDAQLAYQRALDLDKQGKLEDAKSNIDISVNLVPENLDYRKFADHLSEKIRKHRETLQLYKKYLLAGDKFYDKSKYNEALIEYENAESVDDNAEIKGKIIECNVRIKEQKKQKEKIEELLIEIKAALASRNVELAEAKVKEVLSLDSANRAIKGYNAEILQIRKEEEKKEREKERKRTIENLLAEADKQFSKKDYVSALDTYNQVISLDPRNGSIKLKIKECKNAINKQLIRSQISNIENDIQIALQKNDFEKASQLYSQLEQIDVENATTWQKKKDDISYLLKFSSPRFVRGEIANIKAMLRLRKFADAKDLMVKLESNLHLLENNSYDTDIASLKGLIENGNDDVKKKEHRHIAPYPEKNDVLPSENDEKGKKITKAAPKREVKKEKKTKSIEKPTQTNVPDSEGYRLLRGRQYLKAKKLFAIEKNSEMATVCTELIRLEKSMSNGTIKEQEKKRLFELYKKYNINY